MSTLELYNKLIQARMPDEQARIVAEANDLRHDDLVTKAYLDARLEPLATKAELARVDERTSMTNKIAIAIFLTVVLQCIGTLALYKKWI